MSRGHPYAAVYTVLGCIVVLLSLSIAGIIGAKFQTVRYCDRNEGYYPNTSNFNHNRYKRVCDSTCYLGPQGSSYNACTFNYSFVVFGTIGASISSALACARGRVRRRPSWQIAMGVAGATWWLIAGIVNTITLQNANADNVEVSGLDSYRTAIYGISWTCFVLCLASLAVAIQDRLDLKRNPEPQDQGPTGAFSIPMGSYPYTYPQQPGVYPQQPGTYSYPPQPYYGAAPPPNYPQQQQQQGYSYPAQPAGVAVGQPYPPPQGYPAAASSQAGPQYPGAFAQGPPAPGAYRDLAAAKP